MIPEDGVVFAYLEMGECHGSLVVPCCVVGDGGGGGMARGRRAGRGMSGWRRLVRGWSVGQGEGASHSGSEQAEPMLILLAAGDRILLLWIRGGVIGGDAIAAVARWHRTGRSIPPSLDAEELTRLGRASTVRNDLGGPIRGAARAVSVAVPGQLLLAAASAAQGGRRHRIAPRPSRRSRCNDHTYAAATSAVARVAWVVSKVKFHVSIVVCLLLSLTVEDLQISLPISLSLVFDGSTGYIGFTLGLEDVLSLG